MTLLSSQWVILAISVRLDGSVHQREISYLTCEQYKSFSWGFERKTYQKTEVKLLRHWGGTLHLQPGQSNMCEGSVEDLQILVFSFYHRALGIRPRLPGRTVSTFIHWPYAMPPEGAPECSSICKTSPVFAVVANS